MIRPENKRQEENRGFLPVSCHNTLNSLSSSSSSIHLLFSAWHFQLSLILFYPFCFFMFYPPVSTFPLFKMIQDMFRNIVYILNEYAYMPCWRVCMCVSVCACMWEREKAISHLSPDAHSVSYVILAVRQLTNAVVNSNAAFTRSQVLFSHLYPAKRAHSKTL